MSARDPVLLAFDGIARPVALVGCGHLLPILRAALPSWPFAQVAEAGTEPVITLVRRGGRHVIRNPWMDEAILETSDVAAVCSLIVDLVKAFVEDNRDLMCLHGGAALIGDKLLVLPSTYRAGKSTLLAQLAADGVPVFADDVLPIGGPSDHGRALGIAPRLRLPLPGGAGPRLRAFVDRHAGPGDGYYLYLDPPADLLPAYGATAPIGAVVMLDREDDAPAELFAAPRAAALRALIGRNFGIGPGAGDILDRLAAVTDGVPCLTLRYGDLADASQLLRETFGGGATAVGGAAARVPHELAAATGPSAAAPAVDPSRQFRRVDGMALREVDGELFVADAAGDAIHHLNSLGAGIWNLLAEPVSAAEAAGIVAGAFPDADPVAVAADVARLFAELAGSGLIDIAGPDAGAEAAADAP